MMDTGQTPTKADGSRGWRTLNAAGDEQTTTRREPVVGEQSSPAGDSDRLLQSDRVGDLGVAGNDGWVLLGQASETGDDGMCLVEAVVVGEPTRGLADDEAEEED